LPTSLNNLAQALRTVVGSNYVLDNPVDLSVYESDGETLDIALPDLVVLPATTAEVAAVVKLANEYGVPFTPRGAGTGLSGGATTIYGGISLVLTRMTKILELNPEEKLAVVEVGVTNSSVSQAALKHKLFYAPDPSSQLASTIGGNIAENAGGPHTLKYGMTSDHILGLKVVTTDGTVTTLGGRSPCRLGPDLLGLFIGSEGTLGIATEACIRLTPIPDSIETLLAYFPLLEEGGQAVSDIVAAGVIPAAMEMLDTVTVKAVEDALHMGLQTNYGALLIVELDGSILSIASQREVVEEVLKKNNAAHVKWAANAEERKQLWKARKSAFSALGRIAPHGYVLDGVIPRSKLAEAITKIRRIGENYKLIVANVYHAGDGNLHPCILYHRDNEDEVKRVMRAAREILETCVEMGGTLSGEHGIGVEKLMDMPLVFSPRAIAYMQELKMAFNPKGLCNPGKVIPTPRSCGESGLRPLLRHRLSANC
jgi:glycolate oxidase